jgi:outer membrane protein TolC
MSACSKLLAVSFFVAYAMAPIWGQDRAATSRHITLQEAVQLALKHNHAVRIAGLQTEEKQHAKEVAKSLYLPTIRNNSSFIHVTDTQLIQIDAGSLGTVAGSPVPSVNSIINQGGRDLATSGTMLEQPLTQLFTRVKPANDAARADVNAARANEQETENEVALKVREIYYGVLIAQLHQIATKAKIKAAQDLQTERIQQVKYGSTLDADLIESKAESLQAKQDLLTTELQLSDLTMQLDDVIGLPLTTMLELDPAVPGVQASCEPQECVKVALQSHPEIIAAREEVQKASAAVKLSKADYVPDISAFARYSYQSGVPFLARNFGSFGVQFNYELFDGGRRRAALRESDTQLAEAKENVARVSDEVELQVQVAYNKLQRTREMVNVSEELLALRTESSRVSAQQLQHGEAVASQADQAAAQEFDAKAQLLQSQLGYLQASDELSQAMGLTAQ